MGDARRGWGGGVGMGGMETGVSSFSLSSYIN